jgi:hypothetical protein
MQTAELVVLWSSLALALYAYVVYPLLVALASRFARDPKAVPELDGSRTHDWPKVSLLIAARREESLIVERLRNASALNYPPDRLEILVGCDGEGDLTALLARTFEDPRVRVVQLAQRRGVAAVLNACVAKATGDVLVFSDVNTMMRPDAVRRLVPHLQRPDVGAVCGKLLPIDPTTGRNLCGILWKLETALSRAEARLGAISRINSGIYAIRKCLYIPLPEHRTSRPPAWDHRARGQHHRLVYDDTAIAVEETPPTIEAEFRARTKSGADARRSLEQLSAHLGARRSLGVMVARFQRRLRQACPAFLLAAFISNACLSSDPFCLHLLLLHELFYLAALLGLFLSTGNRWRRVLQAPVRLVTKGWAPSRRKWVLISRRRRQLKQSAQSHPSAQHAAR